MPSDQWAVSVLIQEVLSDPDLAHDDVFRRLLQAGFWVLCAAGGVLLFIERSSEHSTDASDASAVSALFLSVPVYIGLTMLAVATTVVVSVVWARNRDAGRRRLVGLA